MADARSDELAAGLHDVRQRIATAAAAADRDPAEVTLVVITKTWPADDVVRLAELGVLDVGENKHQEAEPKWEIAHPQASDARWHFVGQLQSNKATHVARYADVVHSVDSAKLARRLSKGAGEHDRTLECFVQVNLDEHDTSGRGGVSRAELAEVAAAVAESNHLSLAGVMGVAPRDGDPAPAFAVLADCRDQVAAQHAGATAISAGMSGDLEAAIAAGATHVRVGSAVLGKRPPLR